MSVYDDTLPNAGEGRCCYGAAIYGPGRCTCWRVVYDQEQATPQHGPPAVRRSKCADCAFRRGSPERSGDERYSHADEGELADMINDPGAVFFCHEGMRRRIALVHEPTGIRHELDGDAYEPAIAGGVACRADGSPADICAGLAAARRWRR